MSKEVHVNGKPIDIKKCDTLLEPLCLESRKSFSQVLNYLCMVKEQIGQDIPLADMSLVQGTMLENEMSMTCVTAVAVHREGESMKDAVRRSFEDYFESLEATFEENLDDITAQAIGIQKKMEDRQNEKV